jgi:hypothetical protein
MLFKVDIRKPVRETNPEINAIEEFVDLSDRNLKYIFLVYDYDTPYKQIPIDERKKKVALDVGFKTEKGRDLFDKNARDILNGKIDSIEAAIKKFKSLIFDQDRETYISVSELIVNISNMIGTPTKNIAELEKKAKMAQQLTSLSQTKKQLAQILGIRNDMADEEIKKSLDFQRWKSLTKSHNGKILSVFRRVYLSERLPEEKVFWTSKDWRNISSV